MLVNDPLQGLRKEVLEIRDRHPQLSIDNAFVAWFLRAFIVDDEDSAVNALVGGSRDKGVDAIHIDHAARIVFVLQGKYRQSPNPPTEKRSDVLALGDLGRVLLVNDKGPYESLLKDADPPAKNALEKARQALQRRKYRLSLQLATTGKVSRTHEEEATQRVEDWEKAGFEVFSRNDLIRLMQDYIEGASPPVPTVYLPVFDEQPIERYDKSTGVSSWVFTMLGRDLGRLYKEIGDRLFARNIRGYQGKTEVNKSIEVTLKDEPSNFWYYNNGVTIICDEAKGITERGFKKLRVTNAQIINGQQTTRTLASHPDTFATVLAKVIVVPRDSEAEKARYSHLLNQIVTATNWQNAIGQTDLRSNDPEQVRLERELRKLDYFYVRKRQTRSEARRAAGNRDQWFIKKEDIARFAGACLVDPLEVRLGRNRLFEDDVYPIIFDGKPAIEYLIFYWLGRTVSYHSRGDARRAYAKWLVLHFIWSQVGSQMKNHEVMEKFRYLSERFSWEKSLVPLYAAINSIFTVAMAFYRVNRKTKEGVVDESGFFKRKNLHREFQRFWNSSRNTKRAEVKRQLRRFLDNMRRTDR
jgi:hypothetical protein